MTPLPGGLDDAPLVAWRIDKQRHELTWDSGMGAELYGARWNNRGVAMVYCALDPSTAILEKMANSGAAELDENPHVLTSLVVRDLGDVHVVRPDHVPNPVWLQPGHHGAGQRDFGDRLTAAHPFVIVPSTVSIRSWNLVFRPDRAAGRYRQRSQERLALDTRLHPPR